MNIDITQYAHAGLKVKLTGHSFTNNVMFGATFELAVDGIKVVKDELHP